MPVRLTYTTKRAIYLLILICFGMSESSGQKSLSGNLNQPSAHVKTFTPPSDRITVDDYSGFEAGDTVLLIQMQGVEIDVSSTGLYGFMSNLKGQPGLHEFIIIKQLNPPDEIVFEKNIKNAYDPEGKIQVIRVPYYNSAVVNGKLYCNPWDPATGKGGVLALIIGRSLKLNADIDVSSLGFRGAQSVTGDGKCSEDIPLTKDKSYPLSFTNAGLKGEGMAIHDEYHVLLSPTHAKGEGPNFTGGGGGNGIYSGGGGGSNYGKGGTGGNENCLAFAPMTGGIGGIGFNSYGSLSDRIRFGGGGGSSTSVSGLSGSGGNGGGIVIIVADTVFSSGGKIIADGSNGGDGSATGGAGGGGGGGTIALYTNKYGSAPVTFSAKGGNGGANSSSFGEGGGGGGGYIYTYADVSGNVTAQIIGGTSPAVYGAGEAGIKNTGFKAMLNGFLYNSIRSSVSGNQIDSVCSNMNPPKITGTNPVGGTLPYTYLWEKSYDMIAWVPVSSTPDYTPSAPEADTVWFRRTVTDSSLPVQLVDVSMPVKIIVQPEILNNAIGSDQIICYAQDPAAMVSAGALARGNGIYWFKWEVSTDNTNYLLPANSHTGENYTAVPSLKLDSWYRRTVISGRCVSQSNIVFVDVLDTISKNLILNVPPDICNGMTFDNLQGTTTATAQALSGGDGTFRFKWQGRINGSSIWTDAPGTSTLANYDPQELPERIPSNDYYLRRIVVSGAADVCSSTSNTVLFRDYALIKNNTISTSQTICSGSIPAKIAGSIPLYGDGNYSYTWQDSSEFHSWTDISGAVKIASPDYQPPALTDTTAYRRIVYSSQCSDISKSVRIDVHKPVLNNLVSLISAATDTTLCNDQIPNLLKGSAVPTGGTCLPGDFVFSWLQSSDNSSFAPVSSNGTGPDYQPPALISTTYYKRQVTSGACIVLSQPVTLTVLPPLGANTISADQTICYNSIPAKLTGTSPSGGSGIYLYSWEQSTDGGTVWTSAPGTAVAAEYSPVALTAPVKYRRTVKSGLSDCCKSVSNVVSILIHPPLPTGTIQNIADTSVCAGSKVLLNLKLTGSGPWKVTYKENTSDAPVQNVTVANPSFEIMPVSLSAMGIYNYSLVRIEDKNGCVAISLSGSKKAMVYKVPVANAGEDKTVCGPAVTLIANPSVGIGIWKYSADALYSVDNNPAITITMDSSKFVNGKMNYRYYWEESNWQCKSVDSAEVTFYRRVANINAGIDTVLYSFDQVFHLSNDPPESWETGEWTTLTGTGIVSGNLITALSNGSNSFLWKIHNTVETCAVSDILNIDVYNLEIPEGFSPNNDPEGYNNTFMIKGLDPTNQQAELKIVNGAGTEVFSTSNINREWNDWNGKNSQGVDLPEGTYYYLLRIISNNEGAETKIFKKSGFVILKRY